MIYRTRRDDDEAIIGISSDHFFASIQVFQVLDIYILCVKRLNFSSLHTNEILFQFCSLVINEIQS